MAFIDTAKHEKQSTALFKQIEFVPFDPKTRCTEALIQHQGEKTSFRVMKGAVKVIGDACGLTEKEAKQIEEQTLEYALKGYRTLAVAKADFEEKFKLVGLATFYDLPRPTQSNS